MKILCHYFSVNYIIVADRSNWFVKQLKDRIFMPGGGGGGVWFPA